MSLIDQHGITPSLLDRLTDPQSRGTAARPGYSVKQMIDAVHRDLEDLLNTRQTDVGLPEGLLEVRRSIYNYGLPDLNSLQAITTEQREAIGHLIEKTIALFEPRLQDVRAVLLNPEEMRDTKLKYRIDARLSVDPAPDVAFDTVLELTTGHYTVKPSDS
jgi:type VI secretion system protein ImpF